MSTNKTKKAIGDIEGGQAPAELLPSDNITIEHLYQTYRWYPGFEEMHRLAAKALWSNGITDENIPQDRILEMKNAQEFCYLCGYVAVIVRMFTSPPSIEFVHPEIEGIGFIITETSDFGFPLEIKVKTRFNENNVPTGYNVPHFPVKTMQVEAGVDENGEPITKTFHIRDEPIIDKKSYGFFMLRTQKGLSGIRGLPEFMQLMHPIRYQSDILNAYVPYAKKQGMGFPVVYLEDMSMKSTVKTQFSSQPQTNRLLILGQEDEVAWIQPTAQSYDPTFILQWIDNLIARKTQMNKLMLEGDPAGYLSASETAISNWVKETKENQVFWRAQWLPIWKTMGAQDDCSFQDPDKPAFISMMDGLAKFRTATDGVVSRQSQLNVINEYLQKSDKQYKLELITEEEMSLISGNTGQDGDSGNKDQDKTDK